MGLFTKYTTKKLYSGLDSVLSGSLAPEKGKKKEKLIEKAFCKKILDDKGRSVLHLAAANDNVKVIEAYGKYAGEKNMNSTLCCF